ncbi:carbohydrate sulfotransferase 14-like [Amphiura filiformis]|uniref:carbohydrate sulfotransferase 14-like n=1 Tax=Amphiura filiformis TaxID=82378 RepID=UPI003B20B636
MGVTPLGRTCHLIVDDKYKILFNFIPKVSCSTWKKVFKLLRKTHSNGHVRYLSTYENDEKKYRLENYRKALFVREPISRTLSLYLHKFNSRDPKRIPIQRAWENMYGKNIVKLYRKGYTTLSSYTEETEPLLNITFSEWIQYITDIGDGIKLSQITDHFLPQHLVSTPCAIQYDFIGHFENLTTEAPYMLKFLGVDNVVAYPHVRESKAVNTLVNEYKQVSFDLINRLQKYYHADYELFGYSFTDTLHSFVAGATDEGE